jgi:hypothetical protein
MTDGSAGQFINNMKAYDHGAGYLGQTNWQLPPINAGCPTLGCFGPGNPMGILFYIQFGLSAGTPVVEPPDIAVGPFLHLWPSPYWSCAVNTTQAPIQAPCDSTGATASAQFGFSFGDGCLGTAHLLAFHFVTAFYVGCDLPGLWCSPCMIAYWPPQRCRSGPQGHSDGNRGAAAHRRTVALNPCVKPHNVAMGSPSVPT